MNQPGTPREPNLSVPLKRRGVALLCLLAAASDGGLLRAQPGSPPAIPATPVGQFNGNVISLPTNRPASRQSGLTLRIDPRWTNKYGYRPVKVTISTPQASTVARSIRIRLNAGWNRNVSAEQEFELPAGSTSAAVTISLPYYQNAMNYFWCDVWVNGRWDRDLSLDNISSLSWSGGSVGSSNAGVTFLVIGPPGRSRSLVSTNAMELEVLSLEQVEFPTRWIDYTAFDVVSLSLDEARQLSQARPLAFEAIRAWVRSGGQLWICDAGSEWENLPEISRLVGVPEALQMVSDSDRGNDDDIPSNDDGVPPAQAADDTNTDGTNGAGGGQPTTPSDGTVKSANPGDVPPTSSSTTVTQPLQEGWRPLRFRRFRSDGQVVTFMDTRTGQRRPVRDPETIARLENDPNFVTTDQRFDPAAIVAGGRFAGDSREWFVEQRLGLGTVRAFRGVNEAGLFPSLPPAANPNAAANSDSADDLPRALSYGLRRTLRWDSRHGMTPDSANTEFAKLLVPGVGLAPVTEFRVLITLFVLLIGPLNYWLLKRVKRLHLMVLTVPLAALLTTLALFSYAVVADGFGTQVRIHSFTRLDQRTGDAACWARVSYYSGLAPGNGLTVPADTVLYPILPSWAGDVNPAEQRDIVWDGDEAQLTQGWLSSRTPTQYLVIRSCKSRHSLELLASGEKLRVNNRLGTKVLHLVAIDAAGKFHEGRDIEEDATVWLAPAERDDVIRRVSKLIVERLPQAPDALASGESDLNQMRLRSRYQFFGRYGVPYSSGRLSENLAGSALTDLAGLNGQSALNLPPKSYVAITEHGPEVVVGMSGTKEEASLHVIEGKW